MGFSFGGGIGPFRARIGTSGVSGGVGPLSGWTSSRRRRSHQSGLGTLIGLTVGVALVTFLAIWPYLLGTWVAVRLGAGPNSLARAAMGWTFEAAYLGLIIWVGVAAVKGRREGRRREDERLRQRTVRLRHRLISAFQEHPAGVSAAGLPDTEHLLFEMSDVSLIEPRSEHRGGAKVPTEVDRGRAIFSDESLRFLGSKTVTWKWRNLLGMQEGPDFLIFSVSNRQMASGIGADEDRHWAVELATKWALAVHDGEPLDPVRAALSLPAAPNRGAPNHRADSAQGADDAVVGDATSRRPQEAGEEASEQPGNVALAAAAETEKTWGEYLNLLPYASWDVNTPLPPPDSALPSEVREALLRIIELEGPILGGRLYALYASSAGISRVGPSVRRILDRESEELERNGSILTDDPLHEARRSATSFRLPDQPVNKLRELGNRTLHQVPPAELVALMETLPKDPAEDDVLLRGVLDAYGLSRLTQAARERLLHCLSLVTGSP